MKFNLVKLRKHIDAIATTVQEAAALMPEEDGLQIHMLQQLNRELAILKDRTTYIYHMIGSPHHHHTMHRHKRFVFTLAFVIMASAVAIGASIYSSIEVQRIAEEVSTLKAANLITLDSDIQHLLASKDLAAIVEATVAIANKDVQAEAK